MGHGPKVQDLHVKVPTPAAEPQKHAPQFGQGNLTLQLYMRNGSLESQNV